MILKQLPMLLNANLAAKTAANSGLIRIDGSSPSSSNVASLTTTAVISNYAGGNTINTSNTSTGYNAFSLTFGSGTTEPTADDYQMESPYDTTDHFSWQSQAKSGVVNAMTTVITASIASKADDDITISEIGVVYGAGSDTTYGTLLIARSLITPVTIAYGETKTFQYTLDFSEMCG